MSSNDSQAGLQPIPEFESFITKDEQGNDTTDYKAIAENLHKMGTQYEGLAKRNHSDLEKLKKDPRFSKPLEENPQNKEQQPKAAEKTEFDYGELAFLTAKGVSDEDHEFLFEEAKNTGKPLKELLGFKYVQETLKNRAEARATKDATPLGTKRSIQVQSDTPEFWLAKIEAGKAKLSDIPDTQLRHKVNNLHIARDKAKSQFTDTPVV